MSDAEKQPPAPAPAPSGGGTPDVVPYGRFNEVLQQRNELKAQWEQADVDGLRSRATELEQALEAERSGRAEDRALFGAGLTDPEGQAVARFLYGRLEEKPEGGMGAWLSSLSAEGAEVPKPLAPYMAQQAAAEPTASEPPRGSGGARATSRPAPSGPITVETIAKARADFKAGRISADELRAVLDESSKAPPRR